MPKAIAQQTARLDPKVALLEAAAELIAEVGWGSVSSRMVAKRAGLNNALVHYHFVSMGDVLRQAAERVMADAFAAPTREVWRRGDVARGMTDALRWIGRVDVDAVDIMVLVETLVQTRRDPELQRHAAAGLAALRTELARSIDEADGYLEGCGSAGVATLLLALLDGLLLHRVVDPDLGLGSATRSLEALLAGGTEQGASE